MKIKSKKYFKSFLLIGFACLATTLNAQSKENKFLGLKEMRCALSSEFCFGDKSGFTPANAFTELLSTQNNNYLINFEGVFSKKKTTETSFIVGIGCTTMSFKTNYKTPSYSFSTNQDVDGDTYIREYQNLNIHQETSGHSFIFAIAFRERWRLSKSINMYGDLGVNCMVSPSLNANKTDGSAKVTGIYNQYNDISLDKDWGYNGFGSVDLSKATNKDVDVNSFVPISFIRLGFELEMTKACNIIFGATYQRALKNLIKQTDSSNSVNTGNAIIYNTISNMESTENIRNLLGSYRESKFTGMMVNLGLSIRF